MTASTALADHWAGTAKELADGLIEAGYPLSRLAVESGTRVAFDGGFLEVFATRRACIDAWKALMAEDGVGFRKDNVLLVRDGLELTSHYRIALTALLDGEAVPAYDEEAALREQRAALMVWIPTHGGQKYHGNEHCSGMIEPDYVPVQVALFLGFDACKRCGQEI